MRETDQVVEEFFKLCRDKIEKKKKAKDGKILGYTHSWQMYAALCGEKYFYVKILEDMQEFINTKNPDLLIDVANRCAFAWEITKRGSS